MAAIVNQRLCNALPTVLARAAWASVKSLLHQRQGYEIMLVLARAVQSKKQMAQDLR